ncbi:MAG: glutamate mutase L [Chloroflexota bacterium]|nr:glutamate mutase L [Chloroflexota bacterium]
MVKGRPSINILGLDLGRMNTRATLFGNVGGKFALQGSGVARTSFGSDLRFGIGIQEAVQNLQEQVDRILLRPSDKALKQTDPMSLRTDQVVSVVSAGPWMKAALLGLTAKGSLRSCKTLLASLPLENVGAFSLADQAREPDVIEALVKSQPDILIISGGEDAGAEKPLLRWVEVARLMCLLFPATAKPVILFAGNPLVEETVRRRLEPITKLFILPNLYPGDGKLDLIPAQSKLDQEIIRKWRDDFPGWIDLTSPINHTVAMTGFTLSRMVRFLSQIKVNFNEPSITRGVLALNLGGGSTILSAGLDGQSGLLTQKRWESLESEGQEYVMRSVYRWTAEPVSLEEVHKFLCNRPLYDSFVPDNNKELALSQAYARVRLQQAIQAFVSNYSWYQGPSGSGLQTCYEPIIASGAVLTQAPTPGQAMLMLLDGIQPWGITTMVLDKYHILPLLGLIGKTEPVLPVHLLASSAFENLGTVITATSDAPGGEVILKVHVEVESGKNYSADISQGDLRRLVIPPGSPVILELEPKSHTHVGFGARGKGGRLKIIGGVTGVVIDARGRPLSLPQDDELRVAKLHQWQSILGG